MAGEVSHGGRERLNVREQVLLILVAHQLLHVERRRVGEDPISQTSTDLLASSNALQPNVQGPPTGLL